MNYEVITDKIQMACRERSILCPGCPVKTVESTMRQEMGGQVLNKEEILKMFVVATDLINSVHNSTEIGDEFGEARIYLRLRVNPEGFPCCLHGAFLYLKARYQESQTDR